MLAGICADIASSHSAGRLPYLEESSFVPRTMMARFGYARGTALSIATELVMVALVAAWISAYSGALVFLFVAVGVVHTVASLNNVSVVAGPSRVPHWKVNV
jgi:hypothetical protein